MFSVQKEQIFDSSTFLENIFKDIKNFKTSLTKDYMGKNKIMGLSSINNLSLNLQEEKDFVLNFIGESNNE
jgi:hypothetical protein